jgi:gamma-glutamyl-gamma-aminobutyrate hydrolase PuuD
MNILITQRHVQNKYGDWIDCLEDNYIVYLERFGLNLFPVTNVTGRLDEIISAINPSGIVLTGGGDVDTGLYGGQTCDMGVIAKERDRCESKLLEIAVRKAIPVLGICRGMQFINVFFGGKLVAAIKDIDTRGEHGVPSKHNVRITDDAFSKKLGKDKFQVNSYHNRGILRDGLGKYLDAFAVFEGLGLIEAFHHARYPIVGIQWHPERAGSSETLDSMLLHGFVNRTLFWRVRK